MFDFVHQNRRVIQIVLGVVFLPFIFFGVESYFDSRSGDNAVAKVGGEDVTQQEFSRALNQRQEQMRRVLGNNVSAAQLDSPQLRATVLDELIRDRLLMRHAAHEGVVIPDRILQQLIASEKAFQQNGQFSQTQYVELLKEQGLTPASFEASVRQELALQRISDTYRLTPLVSDAAVEQMLHIVAQQRETSIAQIAPDQFLSRVQLAPDAAKQYYDAHPDEFQLPEQVRVDYVVLSPDTVSGVSVTPDEVKQAYEQNPSAYAQGERRRASHILIVVDAKAGDAGKQAARAKAEDLLKQVRANPSKFAELAKQNSQDPGSAAQGGDLGWFTRGAMVKAFDDTVFGLKKNEISDIVETPYGFHIIQLTGIQGQSFDELKPRIEADLKKRKASDKFAALADQLNNVAFEQNDSLKPAADALHVAIQHSGWITRSAASDKLLDTPHVRSAAFSDDVLKDKHNSEVIDVGNNTLVVMRVAEYQPAREQALAEVGANIEQRLRHEEASKLAVQAGEDALAQLQKGENAGSPHWSPSKLVSRNDMQGLPTPLARALFKTDVSKLPAYAGVATPDGGYALLRVTRIAEDAKSLDDAHREALQRQLMQLAGQSELDAIVTTLKDESKVKVNQTLLESKNADAPSSSTSN